MAGKTRVTVADGYAVFVHGEQHSGGDVVDVDADTAQHWVNRGWAVEATEPTKPRTSTSKANTRTRTSKATRTSAP